MTIHYRLDGLPDWGEMWGLPGLAGRVTIRVSRRLSRSLGRCYPEAKRINIHPAVINSPDGLFPEVLCHELAHVAVHELYGKGCRPHGREWKALMRKAGFQPRVRLPWEHAPRSTRRKRRRLWF